MNKSQVLKSVCESISSINEANLTMDEVRNRIKPIHDEYSKIKDQKDYDKFLQKYSKHSDAIDKYFSPSLSDTANKLHYHQHDSLVSDLLDQ